MATSNRAAKMHVSQFSAAALEGLVQRRFHATDLDGNVHPWTKDEIVLMLKEELVVVMRGCNPEITVAEASTLANDIMIHYDVDGSGTVSRCQLKPTRLHCDLSRSHRVCPSLDSLTAGCRLSSEDPLSTSPCRRAPPRRWSSPPVASTGPCRARSPHRPTDYARCLRRGSTPT